MGTLLNYCNHFPAFLFPTNQNGEADVLSSASLHSHTLTLPLALKTRPNHFTKQSSTTLWIFLRFFSLSRH